MEVYPNPGAAALLVPVIGVGPSDRFSLAEAIDRPRMTWSGTVADLTELCAGGGRCAVILLDGDDMAGSLIDVLDQNASVVSRNAVILLISTPSVRMAVAAMQRGVVDVLVKPLTAFRLDGALKDALAVCDRRVADPAT